MGRVITDYKAPKLTNGIDKQWLRASNLKNGSIKMEILERKQRGNARILDRIKKKEGKHGFIMVVSHQLNRFKVFLCNTA